ncbi:SNF2-related protein [Glutamicibacter ardleyensis]|uniref:SNF2-related protein n=1 Tax=Glutamicibacter ardleyensis TaxID=225894 RepID=UPI003FCF0C81
MKLRQILRNLTGRNPDSVEPTATDDFKPSYTPNGVEFSLPPEQFQLVVIGAGGDEAQLQYTLLRILEEQGDATSFPNGFSLSAESMSRFGAEEAEILGLPRLFDGRFTENIRKWTNSADFSFTVMPHLSGHDEPEFERIGALLRIRRHKFRLSLPMLLALQAIENHAGTPLSERTPAVNVKLVAALQKAEGLHHAQVEENTHDEDAGPKASWPFDLGHFKKFHTEEPSSVRIAAETNDDGSLTLTPDLGLVKDPNELAAKWSQLDMSAGSGVLRHGEQLIVINERVLSGINQIRSRGRIPKAQVPDFFEAPGEFFDLESADIELSFNVRVRGIGVVAPVSFAEAADHGIRWIEGLEHLLKPEAIMDLVQDDESLTNVESAIEIARDSKSQVAAIDSHLIDISNKEEVDSVLKRASTKVRDTPQLEPDPPKKSVQIGVIVEDVEDTHEKLRRELEQSAAGFSVDYSLLRRSPFEHQREGITWLLERMMLSLNGAQDSVDRLQGSILADDMGLGKTFMTLVALDEFNRRQKAQSDSALPVLAVLPLSLIENWEDEIKQTFTSSPFDDVVVLQSQRDLDRFKLRGRTRETIADISSIDDEGFLAKDSIKLSLAVGGAYGDARLDRANRLVLTTYETLASFQLSLGQVNWGAVVFDEAQGIKNPDALRTRAAKGLKARFKLLATGTPVENSLRDFWCLMDTAQPGFLGAWPEFRRDWVPAPHSSDEEKTAKGLALSEHVRPFMLRRNKEDRLPNLPSKTIYSGLPSSKDEQFNDSLCVVMSEHQRSSYDAELARHETRKMKSNGAALETIQALRAVSLHADAIGVGLLQGNVSPTDSARLQATLSVLDKVQEADEKAIVFVINKKFQVRLATWLRERYGLVVDIVNGETKAMSANNSETRKGMIRKFEAREGFNVVIMSPLAVGTGLTVVGANHAIHLERHWNPAKEAQATDRIYRIGQHRPVHVYLPLAKHPSRTSFDENLNQLLRSKTNLKDALMVPASVTTAEVQGALGI